MTTVYPYRSGQQIERMIGQFNRVFAGFQVRDGVDRTNENIPQFYRVPVVYGAMDRITASIINKRGYFASNRPLPIISINNTGFVYDTTRKQSASHVDMLMKDANGNSVSRILGVPMRVNMEVNIMASSKSELYELLEQILLIFNPRVTFTLSSDLANPDYLSEITLDSINPEMAYPLSTQMESSVMGLQFSFPTRIQYPHGTINSIIHQIEQNIVMDNDTIIEVIE